VRGRLGYLPTNNLLIFGTGGFAYGRAAQHVAYTNASLGTTIIGFNGSCAPGPCFAGSSAPGLTGWTAGGGLEYAHSQNWTVKAEYLYVSLGSHSFNENVLGPGQLDQTSAITASFGTTAFHIVRAGVNYKF
jgi:outer membrane immunogenic protein